jgi:hypothetical protein
LIVYFGHKLNLSVYRHKIKVKVMDFFSWN